MRHTLLLAFLLSPTLLLNAQSLVTAEIQHGNDAQSTNAVHADASGNIFAGVNFWDDLDADPGPAVLNFNSVGSQDVAILKLEPDGDFIWGKQLGGSGFQSLSDISVDPSGNVYAFGYFNGTMDMDPGPAVFNLVSSGADDIFLGKYSPTGAFLWACKFGGTGTEQNYGFDLDTDGDPVVHGYFQNTVDFNPGPGTFNLTAGFGGSTFVVKLQEDGTFDYAIAMASMYGNQLYVDASDNILITGLFWGTLDFDPGPGTFNLSATAFGNDAFVLKLSPTAAFLWAGTISGAGAEQGTDLIVDTDNNTVTITGFYDNTVDANPGAGTANLVSAGGVDAFLVQWQATTGTYIWSKSIGGLGFQAGYSVDQMSGGNIHLAGTFEQTADFDGGVGVANLTANGATDIFKAQYSNTGNYISADKFGGTTGDGAQDIHLDNEGAILLCGYFDGNVDFDPGPATFNLNSGFTGWDGFIAKYCTVYNITNNVSICAGESYFAAGAWQTTSGVYVDYYTPAEGCDSIVTTNLTVNTPVVDLGDDLSICSGTTTILNAGNPGATYLWNTGATTQTISVGTAGTYSVTITDPAGCTASDAIVITLSPSPDVNLGADIFLCAGETTLLNAGNPGSTYLWNTGATTQTILVGTSGTFSVTVTNPAGCTDADAVVITLSPTPIVNLGADAALCEGESMVLDAGNPGATYLWNTGATTQTITVTTAGNYSVAVTNPGDCSASDNITITTAPSPVVDLGPNQTICEGENILLDAGNPGANYLWNTGAITQSITAAEAGNYSVTVTNDQGCTDTDVMHLFVSPTPTAALPDTIALCADTDVILDAENTGATFLWNTGATTQTIVAEFTGMYTVHIENAFGCSISDSTLVSVLPLPEVFLGEDSGFCTGGSILLDAFLLEATYTWSTGAETASIEADASGTYFVEVTNHFGCSASDTIVITEYPTPLIDLGEDGAWCADDTVILDATWPDATYLWSTGETTADIAVTTSDTYMVVVTDASGCVGSDEISITIHPLPVADLGEDITTCDNVPVILDATTPFCTYLWNTGETSATISTSTAGEYWVQVTNSFGCQLIDSITINTLASTPVSFTYTKGILCHWEAPFPLTGGSPDGGVYEGPGVSDGIFSAELAGEGAHEIAYIFTNDEGCTDTAYQTITVEICHNILTSEVAVLNIYPNPTMFTCTINIPETMIRGQLQVFDLYGQCVYTTNIIHTQQLLNTATFPPGQYHILLQKDGMYVRSSLVVVRE